MPDYDWRPPRPSSVYEDPAAHNAAKRLISYSAKHQPSPIMAISDAFNLTLLAAGRTKVMPEPNPDLLASIIARMILFVMWFGDREQALRFTAAIAQHLFVYQLMDKRMMGNGGGHA